MSSKKFGLFTDTDIAVSPQNYDDLKLSKMVKMIDFQSIISAFMTHF